MTEHLYAVAEMVGRFGEPCPGKQAAYYAAQTPQIFRYARLRQAHAQFVGDATDDAAMVASLGDRVTVFPGSYRNLKVTTPEDLAAVAGWGKGILRNGLA